MDQTREGPLHVYSFCVASRTALLLPLVLIAALGACSSDSTDDARLGVAAAWRQWPQRLSPANPDGHKVVHELLLTRSQAGIGSA